MYIERDVGLESFDTVATSMLINEMKFEAAKGNVLVTTFLLNGWFNYSLNLHNVLHAYFIYYCC